jgi:plasmid stabilization system protein ParE
MADRWVEWAAQAEIDFEAYLDLIASEASAEKAEEIRLEFVELTRLLATRHGIGNATRWPGFRVHGVKKRSKLLVFQTFDDHIEIAAFRDMRQDNSKLRLTSKPK